MSRFAICLLVFLILPGSARAPIVVIDEEQIRRMPWPEVPVPMLRAEAMLDDLLATPPGQEEPDAYALSLRDKYERQLAQRMRLATSMAAAAERHEENGQLTKALALYEKLWTTFPKQQELIGIIRRQRALDEVEMNLTTPEKALLSLKRALMTYKLTAPTFGITYPDTVIYEPGPIEHCMEVLETIIPSLDFDSITVLDALKLLSEEHDFPIVLTQDARPVLAQVKLTISLTEVPLKELLKYMLRSTPGDPRQGVDEQYQRVRMREGKLPLKIYLADGRKPRRFLTGVRQHDHGVPFLDEPEPAIVLGWPSTSHRSELNLQR
jgi:hypothetical protein